MDRDFPALLSVLSAFPVDFERRLELAPAEALDFVPRSWEGIPSEALTIRQQVCHLRDIESDGYLVRFRRLLAEDDPQLQSLDAYALVSERRYDETDLGEALGAFSAARTETVRFLEPLGGEEVLRSGRFEGYGRVTLAGLAHYLASHDQQHLAGVHWLLGQFKTGADRICQSAK